MMQTVASAGCYGGWISEPAPGTGIVTNKNTASLDRLRRRIRRMERSDGATHANVVEPRDAESVRKTIKQRLRRDAETRKGRAKAAEGVGISPLEAIRYDRDVPVATVGPRHHNAPTPESEVKLEEAIDGAPATANDWGEVYVSEERLTDAGREHDLANERFVIACDGPEAPLRHWLTEHLDLDPAAGPEDLVFFDLETCGLGSTPLFLIGAMVFEDGVLIVRQYLARDYSEEAAAMALFAEQLRGRRTLVSFNGKSFDAPFLRTRSAALAAPFPEPPTHLDLLHLARRRWKRELPNCRLQTLESHLCGRQRHDDVPSHLIPEVYHEFVRTGNAWQMAGVMKHNKLDLITLAHIMLCLAEGW